MKDIKETREKINDIDRKMAELFEARMLLSEDVAQYKKEKNLPIEVKEREQEVIQRNFSFIHDPAYQEYYVSFIQHLMDLSKDYQRKLNGEPSLTNSQSSNVNLIFQGKGKEKSTSGYDVIIERGILDHAKEHLNLKRKVLIVSDDGIPMEYIHRLEKQCQEAHVFCFKQGEASKNKDTYFSILKTMLDFDFSRKDCVIALGGGVSGDMAGFAASTYMRGVDFYNIPTTFLAMVDSSIGGKTAIDFEGVKNIVGTFYPPKCVLIDADLLKTLDARQIHAGLAESIKMALTSDKELFERIEASVDLETDYETIIYRSLLIKKNVVEQDEKEKGLRRVLNFGHTIGHAIEAAEKGRLYHGECVAIGMTYFVSPEVKAKLIPVLEKYDLPYQTKLGKKELLPYLIHDKKATGDKVSIIRVNTIGEFEIDDVIIDSLGDIL